VPTQKSRKEIQRKIKTAITFFTHGSHLVDTARFLGGNIMSVQAWHVKKYDAYNWFAMLEYEMEV